MTDLKFRVMIVPHLVPDRVRMWCERVAGCVKKMQRMDHFWSVCGFLYLCDHAEPLVIMKAGQYAGVGGIRNGPYRARRLAKLGKQGRDSGVGMQPHGALYWVWNLQMVVGIVTNGDPAMV